MGFIRFDNHSSPDSAAPSLPASPTDDDFSPSHSSSSKEIALPASSSSSSAQPYPTQSFTHSRSHHHSHHPFHSFTYPHPFFDPPSSPTGLTPPNNPPRRVPPSDHKSSLVVIIFATIGGIIALFFLAYFTRQAIAYSRLPRRNIELTATGRQDLVQELVGYTHRRRQSRLAPPPPYEHAPPYESFSPQQLACANNPS